MVPRRNCRYFFLPKREGWGKLFKLNLYIVLMKYIPNESLFRGLSKEAIWKLKEKEESKSGIAIPDHLF